MFAAVLVLACGAEPQTFKVENKCAPAFRVENKTTPPAATLNAYQRVYARVLAGERVEFTAPCEGFPGEPGEWVGFLQDGKPRMERKGVRATGTAPFPSLTAAQPAALSSGGNPGADPFRGLTPTPARTVMFGGTSTSNCPTGWYSSGST